MSHPDDWTALCLVLALLAVLAGASAVRSARRAEWVARQCTEPAVAVSAPAR